MVSSDERRDSVDRTIKKITNWNLASPDEIQAFIDRNGYPPPMKGEPQQLGEWRFDEVIDYIKNYKTYGDVIPSIAGLSVRLGVTRNALHKWRDRDEAFAELFDKLQAWQEVQLLNGGLRKELEASIVRLALGNHGYKEKKEHGNDPESPINPVNITVIHE